MNAATPPANPTLTPLADAALVDLVVLEDLVPVPVEVVLPLVLVVLFVLEGVGVGPGTGAVVAPLICAWTVALNCPLMLSRVNFAEKLSAGN